MLPILPSTPVSTTRVPRRAFLFYGGASAALGSLWLASCASKDEPTPNPPAPATIAGLAPASGLPGSTVTLTGTNFTGVMAVTVGGVAAVFTVVNANTLILTVPAGAQTGVIAVTTPGGTATSSTPFTVQTPVVNGITGFTPSSGPMGTVVTVMGNGFTGATAVTVGGVAAVFTVLDATTLTLTVPATAQTGVIVVTTPGGAYTSTLAFAVLPPPLVNVGTGDAGVLNYAYALEQLEAAFYAAVTAGPYYAGLSASSAERLVLNDLRDHELIHREFFKAAISAAGFTPIKDLTPDFSAINFADRTSVLNAAKAFEDLGVAAYNGVGRFITSPAYLVLAGKIVSVEARHAALIRDLISYNTFVGPDVISSTTGLELAKRPSDVVLNVNIFLAPGSKLDVSGIA